jgi:hypothetical protein
MVLIQMFMQKEAMSLAAGWRAGYSRTLKPGGEEGDSELETIINMK